MINIRYRNSRLNSSAGFPLVRLERRAAILGSKDLAIPNFYPVFTSLRRIIKFVIV